MKRTALVLSVAFCLIFLSTSVFAGKATGNKSLGQTVYVPASYNSHPVHDYYTRIAIRNIDPAGKITVTSVAFYDPDGNWVKEFLVADLDIDSWSSKTYAASPNTLNQLARYPREGGRPFFIVKWEAEAKVIPPSIGGAILVWDFVDFKARGIMHTSGKVIEEK